MFWIIQKFWAAIFSPQTPASFVYTRFMFRQIAHLLIAANLMPVDTDYTLRVFVMPFGLVWVYVVHLYEEVPIAEAEGQTKVKYPKQFNCTLLSIHGDAFIFRCDSICPALEFVASRVNVWRPSLLPTQARHQAGFTLTHALLYCHFRFRLQLLHVNKTHFLEYLIVQRDSYIKSV